MFTTSCTAENLRLALTETACSEHVCTRNKQSNTTVHRERESKPKQKFS